MYPSSWMSLGLNLCTDADPAAQLRWLSRTSLGPNNTGRTETSGPERTPCSVAVFGQYKEDLCLS